MKALTYIRLLEKLIEEYGDLDVQTYSGNFDRIDCPPPIVTYCKILKKRQSKTGFWDSFDGECQKGEKVFKL